MYRQLIVHHGQLNAKAHRFLIGPDFLRNVLFNDQCENNSCHAEGMSDKVDCGKS